eukprot:CAMPEP_0204899274 /NCGR_PEP_ID=MMETSP1397-20131031/1760_1 /ASSEMBLY_ACC=CAM_ASM_000891 /TAXON_ID=49980 /ORGANISM="Climacostomum Climacostomum virens, Strain Stock W-24" /LENGTH=263 /DNA_ID=CAMNT_0052067221 /DNA_START=234 /DNA_END=1025 /DNA_ORIENTATION=-
MAYIRIQNQQGNTYSLGATKFADMTHEEFRAYVSRPIPHKAHKNPVVIDIEAADSIDWREKNVVTPVKDQGNCGSCWSFSTTGSVEGLHALKTGNLVSYSEQQLVDCSSAYGNYGCNGGLMEDAFQYIEKYGIETEAAYPYTGSDDSCRYNADLADKIVTSFVNVPQTDADLAQALNIGPVSVAIEADQGIFQFYNGGVIQSSACGSSLDHGVLAVGYTSDYWIVKNSWGPSWGDKGYVLLQRDANSKAGTCGILLDASYPTA